MKKIDIIRAWRDEDYLLGLSEAERAKMPQHPASFTEITDADLNGISGGTNSSTHTTITGLCTGCGNIHCY